jgi:hypothetical protein
MSDFQAGGSCEPIRSYQRIFSPQRRIYQVDGRRLPVPGGVPLEWLGWAAGALLAVLVLSTRSLLLTGVVGVAGAVLCADRGWRWLCVGCALGAFAVQSVGLVLGWVDWPLRLIAIPMLAATAASHVTPDGRRADRYLLAVVGWRLRASRRSLERAVPVDGERLVWAPRVWVAGDHRGPLLCHGRVCGPARLLFRAPVVLTARRGRYVVRPAAGHRMRPGERVAEVVEVPAGRVVEIRP